MKITAWFKNLGRPKYHCAKHGCQSEGVKRSGKYPESMDVYVCETHFMKLTEDVIDGMLGVMEDKIVDKVIDDLARFPDVFRIGYPYLIDTQTSFEYWVANGKDYFELRKPQHAFTIRNRDRLWKAYEQWKVGWDATQTYRQLTEIGDTLGVKFNNEEIINNSEFTDFQNAQMSAFHDDDDSTRKAE